MSLEEAVEVLSSEERREAKARCQKWLDEKRSSKILAYDCDGEEVEEFRILRYPFSAEVENWEEEPNVEPRFYCAITGENGKNYLISVYDDYHTEAIRKFEKIKEDKIPTKVKSINEDTNNEVAINGITGSGWYYDRDKETLKKELAEIIKQANDKNSSKIDDGR